MSARPTHCPQCEERVIQPREGGDYCGECGWPDENRPGPDGMKFYLLQRGEHRADHTLHVFDTIDGRVAKTCELIFGTADLDADQERELSLHIEELRDRGIITFEGDPGLEWFNATSSK